MFTIIYLKETGDVVSIVSGKSNEENLRSALGMESGEKDFIFTDSLPTIKEYGQKLQVIDKSLVVTEVELTTQDLRDIRVIECFNVLNQFSPFWYESLGTEKYSELRAWYKAWLDVTKTQKIPDKPSWLK